MHTAGRITRTGEYCSWERV